MAFTVKDWEDEPDLLGVLEGTVVPTSDTPINAAALKDLEERTTDYRDELLTDDQAVSSKWTYGDGVDDSYHAAIDNESRQLQVTLGSSGDPYTDDFPGIKVSKYQEVTQATMLANDTNPNSTFVDHNPAIYAHSEGGADNEGIIVGLFGSARAFNNNANIPAANGQGGDAQGVVGKGRVDATANDVPAALGGVFVARRDRSPNRLTGVEISVDDSSSDEPAVGDTETIGIAIRSHGDVDANAAIAISRPIVDAGFHYGLWILDQNDGAISEASFLDEGSSPDSIRIEGTHSRAIYVLAEAGPIRADGTTASETKYESRITGDSNARHSVGTAGKHFWGGGSGAADCSLGRVSGVIEIDPAVKVLGDLEIDGDLNHDGTEVGFFGVTPATRPSAITQTYSTATRTVANLTAVTLTNNTAATPNDIVANIPALTDSPTTADDLRDDLTTNWRDVIRENFAECARTCNRLIVDLENVKQVQNALIDDLQSLGLEQ